MKRKSIYLLVGSLLLCLAGHTGFGQTSCIQCHTNSEIFDEDRIQIVEDYSAGVHSNADLSCHDCHGGNPDPELSDDLVAAMDPGFDANPYLDLPGRTKIPQFCGRCDSDPVYMKSFRPEVRIDQEEEYWTSQHGKSLKAGDTNVAVCTDCHGTHGIKRIGDSSSPIFPRNVAGTCAKCHSDSDLMSGYKLPDGRALPTHQYKAWISSVHGKAMLEKEDLSAPTCNDCHGNHGATPPGLESITFICGQCHSREANLFRASPKHDGFQMHNEFMVDSEGCTDCHEFSGDPPDLRSFSECSSCHGNHAVVRPSLAMFSPLPETPCAICHEGPSGVAEQSEVKYQDRRDVFLKEGHSKGLSENELFDWLVDQTSIIPDHLATSGTAENRVLRPEFALLFAKFRIGKIQYKIQEESGKSSINTVIRCNTCHDQGLDSEGQSEAEAMAKTYINRITELTAETARAERNLLRAKRGGVEVREVLTDIENAINAQIELQVLVHSFSAEDEGEFTEKYNEGRTSADSALEKGIEALEQLRFRKIGLGISLIFILFVLVGLWLKIRQIG